jgi:hypothetical protein
MTDIEIALGTEQKHLDIIGAFLLLGTAFVEKPIGVGIETAGEPLRVRKTATELHLFKLTVGVTLDEKEAEIVPDKKQVGVRETRVKHFRFHCAAALIADWEYLSQSEICRSNTRQLRNRGKLAYC